MNNTEKLRALLDDRGVRYRHHSGKVNGEACETTEWLSGAFTLSFREFEDGTSYFRAAIIGIGVDPSEFIDMFTGNRGDDAR